METSGKNKWQVRFAVLVIFAIGFAAGALSMNFYRWRRPAPQSAAATGRLDRVINRLGLTSEQEGQVRAIFDDARSELTQIRKESEPKFREVRLRTDERLRSVLSPEQWDQFQQMREEFRGRRPYKRDRIKGQP
ncbi:MAG: periplasmic heavy metal sensor [Blastocatellia bacterium]